MIIDRKDLTGVPTFARSYGLNVKTVSRLIDRGYLTAESIEGRLYIRLDLLQKSIDTETAEARQKYGPDYQPPSLQNWISLAVKHSRR